MDKESYKLFLEAVPERQSFRTCCICTLTASNKKTKRPQYARLYNKSCLDGFLTQEFTSQLEFQRMGLAKAQALQGRRAIRSVLLE